MTTHAMPQPTKIPTPPDFPIEWPDPEMEKVTWRQDRQHVPEPISPMSAWLSRHFAVGFTQGVANIGIPLGVQTARLNTYYYMAVMPTVPPEQMPELEPKIEAAVGQAIGSFWERWQSEWRPEIEQRWREWDAMQASRPNDQELLAHVDHFLALYRRLWAIHFEVLIPGMVGLSLFQDLYADLFPEKSMLDAYKLVQGFESMSLEAGWELWALSRKAKTSPEVVRIIESVPSADLAAELDKSEAGRGFMEELRRYTGYYGQRSDTVQELDSPSWLEDPRPVFDNLKAYVKQDDDPVEAHRALAEEREQLVAEARAAIQNYPEAVKGQFEALLAAGQHCSRLQEDHNFWIDQRSLHEMRELCLEFGRRLVAREELDKPDDVLMLDMDEAREALLGKRTGLRALVTERRAEMDRWRKVTPAPVAGTDYGPPPDNPVTRAIGRFFGDVTPPATNPKDIRGNVGSAGKVTGTARVIITIGEAGKLQQGDILVTATTSPPWTPLFATAGGIVTDTGGVLSHCAIVAREYGIPAVVGAAGATALIPDGATIEVDGDNGIVRVLS